MKNFLSILTLLLMPVASVFAGTKTWDGRHDTENIEVTVVYFVPSDRQPLPDWKDRVNYFARRIEQFHTREFQDQSTMRANVLETPLISESTTAELREGDANAIFFRTLREADRRLKFAQTKQDAFPILLVLSEVNWRPLDDFYRLHPQDGTFEFEGNYTGLQHFPGATSGGARATYLADRGVGWGLVSADGWRVPYRGSDCVVYHEGCGHTVGLPHPETGNDSVMSMGQYRGWISESSVDKEQKLRMGWEPGNNEIDASLELFSAFRAIPKPLVPKPGQPVQLALDWPQHADVKTVRVRYQTAVNGPWIEVPQALTDTAPQFATVGTFDRATPVSYRIDAMLKDGSTAELWGYFQVRTDPQQPPMPSTLSTDLIVQSLESAGIEIVDTVPTTGVNLLELINTDSCWSVGDWTKNERTLESPKRFGARIQLPYSPPEEYRLTLIVEPLDPPNGFLIGQRSGGNRFTTLFNYANGDVASSAIENIDGRNVGNETTFAGNVFQKDQLSQVITTVRKGSIAMSVDGRTIVYHTGAPDNLSLSDYWKTPSSVALFIGAYDCRYRIHRCTLETISGEGRLLTTE